MSRRALFSDWRRRVRPDPRRQRAPGRVCDTVTNFARIGAPRRSTGAVLLKVRRAVGQGDHQVGRAITRWGRASTSLDRAITRWAGRSPGGAGRAPAWAGRSPGGQGRAITSLGCVITSLRLARQGRCHHQLGQVGQRDHQVVGAELGKAKMWSRRGLARRSRGDPWRSDALGSAS
jgi:hypothetical protein